MALKNKLKDKIDGKLLIASKTLTNAQIKAMRATPVTIVPALSGKHILVFKKARLKLIAGANALTESADNMAFKLTDGSGAAVSQTIEATGFIDQTADTETNAEPKIDTIVADASMAGKPIVLHNTGDGEYGGNAAADARLYVEVEYAVKNLS